MIDIATLKDLKEMDSLRRANQEMVGFVPLSKWEWHISHRPTTLLVLREESEITGYLYWTPGHPVASIQQLVIREDLRRLDRGTMLVKALIRLLFDAPSWYGVTCRCRADLEATIFWKILGFELIRVEQSGRRGPVLRYYKELKPTLLPLGIYLPEKFRGGGQRHGYRLIKNKGV